MNRKTVKEELLELIIPDQIVAMNIQLFDDMPLYFAGEVARNIVATLKVQHTEDEVNEALRKLDTRWHDYRPSGYIWLRSGDWIEFDEYDGVYYWSIRMAPVIPSELREYELQD